MPSKAEIPELILKISSPSGDEGKVAILREAYFVQKEDFRTQRWRHAGGTIKVVSVCAAIAWMFSIACPVICG